MNRLLTVTLPLSMMAFALLYAFSTQILHSQNTLKDQTPAVMPAVPENHEIATFAGGCFWCVEVVFEKLDGVKSVTSGYTGGHVADPTYKAVTRGLTGHAESVQVVFDPEIISYDELLDWFWRMHNPTQLNRQGADVGTHYRSAIYYHSDTQKELASKSKVAVQPNFKSPIVTEVTEASTFYPAEVSHQDYYKLNGSKNPYCRAVIAPKLEKLKLN